MAQSRLDRTPLGAAGLEWVTELLAENRDEGRALASAVTDSVDLRAGQVFGFFPASRGGVEITKFEWGIYAALAAGSDRSEHALATDAADAVIEFARSLGGELFISELYLRRPAFQPGMSWGEGVSLKAEGIAFHGESVLPWRRLREVSTDEIGWLVGHEFGLISSFAPTEEFTALAELSGETLRRIASGTRTILAGAYDGTSLIVWVRVETA